MNKRMTKRDTDGLAMMDCQKCEADWTGKHGKPMADCTALYCRNRLLDRLVEYEDTGLTPEQIKELEHDTTGPLHRKISEWIDAEAAGRLVVPPCKVGDRLYEVTGRKTISVYKVKAIRVELFGLFIEWDIVEGFVWQSLAGINAGEIGKTVFLTREEAEEALKEVEQKLYTPFMREIM